MKSKNATIPETLRMLNRLRMDCQHGKITSIVKFLREHNFDNGLSPVLIGIEIVKKIRGKYRWVEAIENNPTEDLAILLRATAKEYKYAF